MWQTHFVFAAIPKCYFETNKALIDQQQRKVLWESEKCLKDVST